MDHLCLPPHLLVAVDKKYPDDDTRDYDDVLVEWSSSDEEEEEWMEVELTAARKTLPHVSFRAPRVREVREAPADEEHIRTRFPVAELRERTRSAIAHMWDQLDEAIRLFFDARLQANSRGYVNVTPQPGSGAGYQVQLWMSDVKKHLRLGTVLDPKVGALLYAAASIDRDLLARPLAARDWFYEVVDDPERFRAWVDDRPSSITSL